MEGHSSPPHYGLPPLPSLPCPEMKGPTSWSNWVIRGRVLAGAYPASLDDYETERILTTLLELGINTFVCLQAEFALHTPESAWRAGQGLRPYIKDAQRILIRARETHSPRITQDKLDFLHLPIIDGSVTSDTAMSRLADDCNMRVLRGERLYIHCWGGHGRTGTLVATMLGRLYNLSCSNALRYTQTFHDSRKYPQGVRSPQTQVQVAQVRRLLPDPPSLRGIVYPQPTMLLTSDILCPASAPTSPLSLALPPGPSISDLLDKAQLPINEQRKQGIRAKHAGAQAADGEALAEAIDRAFISTPGPRQQAAASSGGGSAGGGAEAVQQQRGDMPPQRPSSSPTTEAVARQAAYLQQYMVQRKMTAQGAGASGAGAAQEGGRAAAAAAAAGPTPGNGAGNTKLGSKLGTCWGPVVNLTATSGGASLAGSAAVAGRTMPPFAGEDFDDDTGISGPLRPSKLEVTVPQAPMAAGGRIGAMLP